MQYEDIWQIQDEITSAVNSLGYSLWDLHYDRASFSFHLELTMLSRPSALRCHCQQTMRAKAPMAPCLRYTHKFNEYEDKEY